MDQWHAQTQFQKADDFYRQKRYAESLKVLDSLDAAFPNTRNILFPKARCLRRLGRFQEAMAICDQLIELYDDERATELKAAIASAQAAKERESSAGFTPLTMEDLGLDRPAARTPAAPVNAPPRRSSVPILAVSIILLAGAILLGIWFLVSFILGLKMI